MSFLPLTGVTVIRSYQVKKRNNVFTLLKRSSAIFLMLSLPMKSHCSLSFFCTETVQMMCSPSAACQDRPGESHNHESDCQHPSYCMQIFSSKCTALHSVGKENNLHCVNSTKSCHAAVNPVRVLSSDKSSQAGWAQGQTLDLG